jgi:ABC-2 type transport system permease protein
VDRYLIFSSPVSIFYYANGNGNEATTLTAGIVCVLAALVLFYLGLVLNRGRPSEAAGHAISFKTARPIIKYPIVLVITLLGGLFFSSIAAGGSGAGIAWMIFGFVCGAALSHFVMEIIYSFDFKAIFKNIKGLGIFCVVFAAAAACMGLDLTGYDRYIPARDSIEGVSIDIGSFVDNYTEYSALDDIQGRLDSRIKNRMMSTVIRDEGIIDEALKLAQEGVEVQKSGYSDTQEY